MIDGQQIQQEVEELEPRVERLKSLYQQYFMGIEKIPPEVLRKEVDRTIWRLRREHFHNTRLRFKFQQIVQRYNTYQQYWSRIQRQIEKGTYERDVIRAARRFGGEVVTNAGRRAQRALRRMDGDGSSIPPSSSRDGAWDEAPTPPARQVPAELQASVVQSPVPPPPPKRALPGMRAGRPANEPTGERTREIYEEYLRARRAAGESTAGISYEKLASSLATQTRLLRQKHGANANVDYAVVTKDGRTMIRPVIK